MKALLILLVAAGTLHGQTAGSRELGVGSRGKGPAEEFFALALQVPSPAPRIPNSHRFADRTNIILTATHATLRGLDVVTTRHLLSQGGRERILPRAVVNSTPAFIAFSAAEVAGTALLMYAAHRARHHRIERALGWVQVGFMGTLVVNNALVIRGQHRLGW